MVRCTVCAFLASTGSGATTYLEIGILQRKHLDEAEANIDLHDKKNAYLCFADAADLSDEYGIATNTDEYSTLPTTVVISKDRKCEKFVPYKVGYSPKEMAERVHKSQLIAIAEARLVADKERGAAAALISEERAEDRRRDDKGWQVQQRKEDIERQEQRDRQERKHRVQLSVFSILFTAVVGGLSASAGYLGKGYADRQAVRELQQRQELLDNANR